MNLNEALESIQMPCVIVSKEALKTLTEEEFDILWGLVGKTFKNRLGIASPSPDRGK